MDMPEEKDQDELLRSATAWQWHRKDRTSPLSKCLDGYMRTRQRALEKNSVVVDVWQQILPDEINRHCRLAEISKGVLRVEVDPGPYMHEMRLLSGELVDLLNRSCPRAGIKKVSLFARKADSNNRSDLTE